MSFWGSFVGVCGWTRFKDLIETIKGVVDLEELVAKIAVFWTSQNECFWLVRESLVCGLFYLKRISLKYLLFADFSLA